MKDEEYSLLGEAWDENMTPEDGSAGIVQLESYHYFDGTKIRGSMQIPMSVVREGRKLSESGMIEIQSVRSGFARNSEEILGQVDATGKSGREEFSMQLVFSRGAVRHFSCGCPKCRRDYYSAWQIEKTNCPYKAGLLTMTADYVNSHNLGDATDEDGMMLMTAFQGRQAQLLIADATAKKESLKLVPRLIRKNGKLEVSFKVGSGRLFIVKKLDEFCENVRESATGRYGSSTEINHSIDNFSEHGKEWIRFISRIVKEETEFTERLAESRNYYYAPPAIGSSLNLFGWRIDEFYERLDEDGVEFEDRDAAQKTKVTLHRRKGNPQVTMRIADAGRKNDREFHGIAVSGVLPQLYYGMDTAYYIGGDGFYRAEESFLKKIEPLTVVSEGDSFSFLVGRNHMAEFYYRVLPQLQDIVTVTETNPRRFRSFLPPDVQFVFYLDARDGDLVCRAVARYGEKEEQLLDVSATNRRGKALAPYRNAARENEVLFVVMCWFSEIDEKQGELCCGGDERRIYEVMAHGTEKLMELGEVRCTKRFLGYHVVNRVKVSVGVSVSSGLLDLTVATEDIPPDELLDLLASYRRKQKYYRLKDGSFVNLEDPSLEMLSELMESMHVKPKEFVKGKMHLPLYRTLYLDKMLEENDSIYSRRDSHFREMVKGFKTVKDADFEEPASLSDIMRNYQKNGYKWLRTLECWGFGGILADDMGLGKTLQIISVLLAAKQEGKKGTSLIVAPASLVFNWGEEFARFAPELSVSLIVGTQEERRAKLAAYQDSDVLVTSYDLLKRDIAEYEDKQFQYEVIDEAQYIKNHTTAAAKAVKIVKGEQRFALTGTPIENRLSELWSIFDYLMPGFLYSYDVFKKDFETPIVRNQDETAMNRLQRMVAPFILRRLKQDVLKDLPEKLEELRYVRFGEEQQRVYDAQVLHMRELLESQAAEDFNKNRMKLLAELTRLRQLCCDPALCFENYKGGSAKEEAALQLVHSAIDGGHRLLVFSQFTSMLEILGKELDRAGIPWYTITGATSKERRLQLVREFNEGDVPVFLISLKAGGVGLNLTGADVVLHYDPWWNLAAQNQATDRAHRIGQTRKVTVYKLIAKDSIEEKIQKLQEMKKDLADQIIGGELGQLAGLGREEMLELLGA